MSKHTSGGHKIHMIFPIILFLVFALSAVTLLLMAAGSYERSSKALISGYSADTGLAYITEKIHRNDVDGAIRLGQLEGQPALIIDSSIDGVDCCTYIYNYEGSICELFARADLEPQAFAGQKILENIELDFSEQRPDLILMTCTDTEGHSADALIHIRSSERN